MIAPAPIAGSPARHITVCVCTFRRPVLLQRLLEALGSQKTVGSFSYSVVVADNDPAKSAEEIVEPFANSASFPVTYCHELRQNIALARNKALEHATSEFVAFLDDDEFPVPEWLQNMVRACDEHRASGVLGPVRPRFEEEPPAWVIRGRFCERPEHPTGRRMQWNECRTGNLLFRREILEGLAEPFDPQFGTGGEDIDFFHRMDRAGRVFVWCNEAPAYESVPASRLTRGYMLRRALLRGKNNRKLSATCWKSILLSLVAVPIYLVVLPAAAVLGQHCLMKYFIRFCDHAGKILALFGANPIQQREM